MHPKQSILQGFHPYNSCEINNLRGPHSPNPQLLRKVTVNLIQTYIHCDPNFSYNPEKIPRRVLTIPSEGVFNEGFDNINHNYILRINDKLLSLRNDEIKTEYLILEFLGQGTFGQVVKCLNIKTNDLVAIKIIKNQKSYYNQGKSEVRILKKLNEKDPETNRKIVKLLDCFYYRFHLCLVFELLDVSLLDLLYSTDFKGIALSDIAFYTKQLLQGLIKAHEEKIVHCDIKPENILFIAQYSSELKIIDFGSACFEKKANVSYIQSRHYRSPEVLLGDPYGMPIDMWSLGCVVAELYLGLPIFPGNSDYDQMRRIVELLGNPHDEMIKNGKFSGKFFKIQDNKLALKTKMEYEEMENKKLEEPKNLRKITKLEDIINYYSYSPLREQENKKEEIKNFEIFLDFLKDLLNLDPVKRVPASKAIIHPFITNLEKFNEKIDVKLPFFENEEKKLERALLRKKIKLSNRHFEPANLTTTTNIASTQPPLSEATYNNIYQENEEKNLGQHRKNKKIGFKKQHFFNNQPPFYNNLPYFNNNQAFCFDPQMPYGVMNMNMINPAFYNNMNFPPQPQSFFIAYNNNMNPFDFYHQFDNMKIGTPFDPNINQWTNFQGQNPILQENDTKKKNNFVKKSKYIKSK